MFSAKYSDIFNIAAQYKDCATRVRLYPARLCGELSEKLLYARVVYGSIPLLDASVLYGSIPFDPVADSSEKLLYAWVVYGSIPLLDASVVYGSIPLDPLADSSE